MTDKLIVMWKFSNGVFFSHCTFKAFWFFFKEKQMCFFPSSLFGILSFELPVNLGKCFGNTAHGTILKRNVLLKKKKS